MREIFLTRIELGLNGCNLIFSSPALEFFKKIPGSRPVSKSKRGRAKKYFMQDFFNLHEILWMLSTQELHPDMVYRDDVRPTLESSKSHYGHNQTVFNSTPYNRTKAIPLEKIPESYSFDSLFKHSPVMGVARASTLVKLGQPIVAPRGKGL